MSRWIPRLALAALVTLSVTGGAATALAGPVPHSRTLEHRALGVRWREAGQAQERARPLLGSAAPTPEPRPTAPTRGAPAGDTRGNATVTAVALLLALGARLSRWRHGRRSTGRRPIPTQGRRHGR